MSLAEAFSEFAFGLLDDDPAVQGRLQLLADDFGAAQVAFVEQADGCGIGQGLADAHLGGVEGAGIFVREIPGGTRARHRSRPVDLPEHRY
jgi:tetrahydromethanopterin S-methyltransferase subunit H